MWYLLSFKNKGMVHNVDLRGNATKMKETSLAGVTSSSAKSITTRLKEIEKMKRFFSMWSEHQTVSDLSHREKASSISIQTPWKKSTCPAEVLFVALVVAGLVVSNTAGPSVGSTWLFSQKKTRKDYRQLASTHELVRCVCQEGTWEP